jgi:hypothetical protein
MDPVYDPTQIHSNREKMGHNPVIDHNPLRGEKMYMTPTTNERFS